MTLQQLEYVLAVDQHKNFTRAAEHCYVTQATLSAMVKKLEEELGVVFFDRKASPVVTTEEGRILVEEARQIVLRSKVMLENARGINGLMQGELHIGIIPTIASALLPLVLPEVLSTYPALKLHVREMNTEQIVKELKSGRLDAGILATPLSKSELEAHVLYYETLLVYGRQAGDKSYVLPEELAEGDVWMLEEGHCLREQFINICALRKHQQSPGRLHFEASSFETLLGMVDTFGGLTLIPELYYRLLEPLKKERVAYFEKPFPVREVSLVYYRPFAKARMLSAVAETISAHVHPLLMSSAYRKSDLHIASI